jgi:hypothetical protein
MTATQIHEIIMANVDSTPLEMPSGGTRVEVRTYVENGCLFKI